MKIFIIAIILTQLDLYGNPYNVKYEENPFVEYNTLEECLSASKIRGDNMYASSLKYPELKIVNIRINCIEAEPSKKDTI